MAETAQEPRGALAIRVLAMPADANPNGDIFGGWVLGQMDIAGGVIAKQRTDGRVATVAVDAMTFKLPVFVGDMLSCHGEVVKIGRTSIQVWVEAWATRAVSCQYSTVWKPWISRSLSTRRRTATDCTRPADRPRRTLSQRRGLIW